jgi:hypothetical protein
VEWWQFVGLVVAVVVPVGLAIHGAGKARSDRNEKRIDDHVADDTKAHERLARLETKVEHLEVEVLSLRKRFHDSVDDAKKLMWKLYEEFMAEVRRLIKK